jgi:hypothetical protein
MVRDVFLVIFFVKRSSTYSIGLDMEERVLVLETPSAPNAEDDLIKLDATRQPQVFDAVSYYYF